MAPLRPMHWMDRLYARVAASPRFYSSGWGDWTAAADLGELLRAPQSPAPIAPSLRRRGAAWGVVAHEGSFPSPAVGLPAEARVARFELLLPAGARTPPVCIHLASTGDEGYALRRRLALPLVRAGIGALLLENPYYGARRPAGQEGHRLRRVADQFVMNRATVEEARSLLGWLRAEGHAVGVSGYSMGGSMAAYAAVCTPFPVVVVPAATGSSAAHLVTRDVLSLQVCWDRLGDPDVARRRLGDALEAVALHRLPAPPDPSRAVLVGCRTDGYVDPAGVAALHRHWAGSTLRWLDTGHLAGLLAHGDEIRRAIADAFAGRPGLR